MYNIFFSWRAPSDLLYTLYAWMCNGEGGHHMEYSNSYLDPLGQSVKFSSGKRRITILCTDIISNDGGVTLTAIIKIILHDS